MAETVDVPGLGAQPRRMVLLAGGITAGIVGYAWWRHRGTSSTSASSTPVDAGIDPATGLPYPDSGQGGAYGYGYNPFAPGGGSADPTPVPQAPQFATNAQWAQAAEEYLVGSAGSDAATVADALGRYITAAPVTDAQHTVISAAIAFEGYPPVSGPAGKPPGMTLVAVPVPPPTKPAVFATRTYHVKPGDTIASIATHFKVTWQYVLDNNRTRIKDQAHLIPGTALYLWSSVPA